MKFYSSLLFVILLLACSNTFAQNKPKPAKPQEKPPTQKEIDDIMKEALKEMDKLSPEQKAMFEQKFKQQMPQNNRGDDNHLVPKKQTTLLSRIKKVTTPEQFNQYLDELLIQAKKNISSSVISQVDNMMLKYKGNKIAIHNLPMMLCLQKKMDAAIYAAIVCAKQNKDVILSQNNLAFILHQSGYAFHALPILEYYLSKSPNPIIYNNAGQCYFTLGDTAKAMKYFIAATRLDDNLAESHCGIAMILLEQKKEKEAIQHIEKAFRDGYSQTLDDYVMSNNLKLNSIKMAKPVKEYFKPVEYAPLPPVKDREALIKKDKKLSYLESAQAKWEQKRQATAGAFQTGNTSWELRKNTETFTNGLKRKAWLMSYFLNQDLVTYINDNIAALTNSNQRIEKKYAEMENGIAEAYKKSSFNSDYEQCKMKERFLDTYLRETFITAKETQDLLSHTIITNVNQQLHWFQFLLKENELNHQYYNLGSNIMSSQISLSKVQRMYPLPINIAYECNEVLNHPPNPDDLEDENVKCDYSIKIPFGVGSIKFTCDGWEIEGGELLVGNISQKNNRSRDFTVAIGLGLEAQSLAAGAGIKAQFYLSGNNDGFTDMGWRGEVKGEVNTVVKQYEAGYNAQIGISGIVVNEMNGFDSKSIFNYDPKK